MKDEGLSEGGCIVEKRKPAKAVLALLVTLLIGTSVAFSNTPGIGYNWWRQSFFGQRPAQLYLTGTVEATSIPVAAEIAGRVVELSVDEGAIIQPGTVVARLDAAYAEALVRQAEAAHLAAQARLDEAEAGSRGLQIKQAQATVEQGRAQQSQMRGVIEQAMANLDGARKHLAYQEKILADQKKLHQSGAVPAKNVTDAQALVDEAKARVSSWEAQLNSAQGQLASTEAATKAAQAQLGLLVEGSTSQTIRNLAAQVSQAYAALEAARVQLDRCTVKALRGGTVQRQHVRLGQVINPGTPIVTMLDLKDMWVRIYVPEASLDRVALGKTVVIKADAYPDKVFKGEIIQINDQGEFTPKNIQTPEERTRLVFAVKVRIIEGLGELKPGMPVDVDLGSRAEVK